jgi:hypothetical protein
MTKADSRATKELESQRLLNLAKLMNENSFLIDRDAKYKETRYVIESHREKSRKIGDRWQEEEDTGKKKLEGTQGEDEAHVDNKETVGMADQIKEMSHTIQEMKAMIQAMAKKQ